VFTRGRTEQALQRFPTEALARALEERAIHSNHSVRTSAQDFGDLPSSALEPVAERQVMTAWENFVTGAPVANAAVSKVVLSSWQRSRRAGVEPGTRFAPVVTSGDALEHLRRMNHDLLWAAQGLFVTSAHLLECSGSIMLLTDPNGVVLEIAGDMRTLESAQDIHLIEGGHWHESVVGTNGIGTALAMRRPVQVHAAEHFGEGIKSWTCAAAPVFFPGTERVLGVIDISGPPSTYQRGNLLLALAAARQMEAVLADRANREHVQLLEASMKFGAASAAEAMLVLDRNAKLIYASGGLPGFECRLGSCLPGLEAGRSAQEWARHLPAALRGEWLHPIRVDGVTIGAVIWVPKLIKGVTVARVGPASLIGRPGDSRIEPLRDDFTKLRGHSAALRTAVERARLLGARRVSVLIQGETGVGKELFARAIHGDDERSGPYITFNCGATSKELIGSELFGHVRGAYTGATQEGRAGRFELAHGGTLCLDEIGELPLDLQPVLLRCLEEGVVSRLGEAKLRRVDVRLLAMTNRDLLRDVEDGRFRRDLYHRISVTCVRVPPLREREGDVDVLVDHFNRSLAERHGVSCRRFGPDVMAALRTYGWPGNVRELRNVVESLLLTCNESDVQCAELPEELRRGGADPHAHAASVAVAASLEETERLAIVRAVHETHGNLAQAARALGVSRSTLYRKVERYHLESIVRHDGDAGPAVQRSSS
jgi:transcriptional regulator of acetoin/glycerol metabolism